MEVNIWYWISIAIYTVVILGAARFVFKRKEESYTKTYSVGRDSVSGPVEIKYASLWDRFLALFIDGLLLLPLGIPSIILDNAESEYLALVLVAQSLLGFAYYIYFEYKKGQTVGKMLMKIRVIGDDGDLTISSVVVRNILRLGGGFLILIGAGLLYLIWMIVAAISIWRSDKKQRPFDRLARTIVVKK